LHLNAPKTIKLSGLIPHCTIVAPKMGKITNRIVSKFYNICVYELIRLTKTDFKKTSPGGIFRVRYFNLEDVLESVPDDINMIAEQLKT